MFGHLDKYIAALLTGFVVTYLLTPRVRSLAQRLGIVDVPQGRHQHARPTARGGGVAVFAGVHAACAVVLLLPWEPFSGGLSVAWWQRFAAASLVLLGVGIIDDLRGVRPWIKLAGQVLAGAVLFLSGSRIGSVFGYELPGWLDGAMTVFWLVAVINAFNLIDGLDGLAAGLAITSALGLCGFFVLSRLPGNTLVLLGLIGACLAFLRYNFHPASIFLGDSGSMFLGLALGAVSLETFTKGTFVLSVTIPLLVLGVPFFDTALAIWRRSIRMLLPRRDPDAAALSRGIMQGDVEHLHHRLAHAGLNARRVAAVLWAANAGLVAVGLGMMLLKSQAVGIFMLALLAGLYVVTRQVAAIELRDTGRAVLAGLRRPGRKAVTALAYPAWDVVALAAAWEAALHIFPHPGHQWWATWLVNLPLWITPTFALLVVLQMYRVVWSRARAADVILFEVALFSGLFLSVALALVLGTAEWKDVLLYGLGVGAISHPGMLGARVLFRFVEELVPRLSGRRTSDRPRERVVLYGAGGRCRLFLRERDFPDSRSLDDREIVGLIDDDPALCSRLVYGYKVLGGRRDLARLASELRLGGVIITAILSSEALAAVERIACQHRLRLSEWRMEERELNVVPALAVAPERERVGRRAARQAIRSADPV